MQALDMTKITDWKKYLTSGRIWNSGSGPGGFGPSSCGCVCLIEKNDIGEKNWGSLWFDPRTSLGCEHAWLTSWAGAVILLQKEHGPLWMDPKAKPWSSMSAEESLPAVNLITLQEICQLVTTTIGHWKVTNFHLRPFCDQKQKVKSWRS